MKTTAAVFVSTALIALAGCLCVTTPARTAFVDEYRLETQSCGHGKKVAPRLSVNGHPLTVGGKRYARGFGAHPESAVVFAANGKVRAFDALVALDDDATEGLPANHAPAKCVFRVWADGKVVATSPCMTEGTAPFALHADLLGAREIYLETRSHDGFQALNRENGDWLEARFTCDAGAELKLKEDPEQFAQLGRLTPPPSDRPQFNGADVWGVRPGHEVIFRIPVSGKRPLRFSATGLPDGITLDARGVLRGTAPAKGRYDILVKARNDVGEAERSIRLQVGDTIALTPPMGWNSWNCFCYRLTDKAVRDAARAMDESGLADYGWAYVNLDDWWSMNNAENCPRREQRRQELGHEDVLGPARDAQGNILPNRSFPDMKALTDYIHGLGLKAGIYSGPGPETCGLCEASFGHELQDATSWAAWGFDYLKYDWCSYNYRFRDLTGAYLSEKTPRCEEAIRPYALMNDCLKRQNRDIVYSFCQYGRAKTEEWARANGANCWRSWDDFHDGYAWMERAIESYIGGEFWKHSGPGCWVDPDMMVVGGQHSCGYDHPSFLTPNEQYTHVSVWAMVGSPLLIGCDLTQLDDFTRGLLMNREVIALNQDSLGKVARRWRHADAEDIWVRPLANGDSALALVNRSPVARTISVPLSDCGLAAPRYDVRDCWRQKDEPGAAGTYTATVPAHATKLVRLTPVSCAKCD